MHTNSTLTANAAPSSALRGLREVSPDAFKAAFRNHPGGVAVITADAGHGPAALTATSVISVSLAPPLLVFSLSAMSSSTATLRAAKTAVVHLLTVDELELAKLCATSGVDRFADCSTWSRLPTGEPFFHSAPVWIRGKVVGEMVAGDSAVIALEALDVGLPPADKPVPEPLVYHNRTWHRLGSYSTLPS